MKLTSSGKSLGTKCFGEQASTISTNKDRSALVRVGGGRNLFGVPSTRGATKLAIDCLPRDPIVATLENLDVYDFVGTPAVYKSIAPNIFTPPALSGPFLRARR
jgi:hypothetical protein